MSKRALGRSPVETVFLVMSAYQAYVGKYGEDEKRGAIQSIATKIMLSETYVGKLIKIGKTIPEECLNHWKANPNNVSFVDMYRLTENSLTPLQRTQAYNALSKGETWPNMLRKLVRDDLSPEDVEDYAASIITKERMQQLRQYGLRVVLDPLRWSGPEQEQEKNNG